MTESNIGKCYACQEVKPLTFTEVATPTGVYGRYLCENCQVTSESGQPQKCRCVKGGECTCNQPQKENEYCLEKSQMGFSCDYHFGHGGIHENKFRDIQWRNVGNKEDKLTIWNCTKCNKPLPTSQTFSKNWELGKSFICNDCLPPKTEPKPKIFDAKPESHDINEGYPSFTEVGLMPFDDQTCAQCGRKDLPTCTQPFKGQKYLLCAKCSIEENGEIIGPMVLKDYPDYTEIIPSKFDPQPRMAKETTMEPQEADLIHAQHVREDWEKDNSKLNDVPANPINPDYSHLCFFCGQKAINHNFHFEGFDYPACEVCSNYSLGEAQLKVDEYLGRQKGIKQMGQDTPITTNEQGGSQSKIPYAFHLLDAPAMFKLAEVLHHGAKKYEPNNWRKISTADHLNHALAHQMAYLAGDIQDDHLEHAFCRLMMALGVKLEGRG